MDTGLAALLSTGARLRRPYYLGLLAEAYADAGRLDEALERIEEALALVERTGERWWEAELRRLGGELVLANGDESRAATAFHRAVDVARRQNAAALRGRAMASAGRLG